MLVFSRKDGENITFFNGRRSAIIEVRCDDDALKFYKGGRRILKIETVQDTETISILGFDIEIMLVRWRACDDVTIGFRASSELRIWRDDFAGQHSLP